MVTGSFMSNEQVKVLCLAVVSGCGLISFGVGHGDSGAICGLVTIVILIWFIVKYSKLKP
jgi:hypothetical protein